MITVHEIVLKVRILYCGLLLLALKKSQIKMLISPYKIAKTITNITMITINVMIVARFHLAIPAHLAS